MTREELIKHLHEALDFVDIHFPYRYVFVEAIEALSQPSLSDLGEAAEEYSLDVKAKPYGNLVKEAFKGGATWRDAQIPSLPSNLDEAARDYCNSQPGWENKMDWVEEKDKEECRRDFKAGAEWMARQGETVEGEVVSTSSDGWECVKLYKKLHSVDDKVIVQIRKK